MYGQGCQGQSEHPEGEVVLGWLKHLWDNHGDEIMAPILEGEYLDLNGVPSEIRTHMVYYGGACVLSWVLAEDEYGAFEFPMDNDGLNDWLAERWQDRGPNTMEPVYADQCPEVQRTPRHVLEELVLWGICRIADTVLDSVEDGLTVGAMLSIAGVRPQ